MRVSISKIALVAIIGLALVFTVSCSDDDKDGWLSCSELNTLSNKCSNQYDSEYDKCNGDDSCDEEVNAKVGLCILDDACNGSKTSECMEHYKKECPDDEEL